MLVIGLTGGIGSGKSTVAKLFQEKGIDIIDTDEIARVVVEPGKTAYKKIVDEFGASVVSEDGTLDRAKLRKIIFSNEKNRIWLEKLLHPLIYEEMQHRIARVTSPYCIAVIPLLIETGSHPIINRVLVVDTTEEEQIARAQKRDQLSEKEIKAVIQSQVSRQKRLAAADDIIQNDHLKELAPQVDKLHEFYLSF